IRKSQDKALTQRLVDCVCRCFGRFTAGVELDFRPGLFLVAGTSAVPAHRSFGIGSVTNALPPSALIAYGRLRAFIPFTSRVCSAGVHINK
ncbi:MAG: hypothetical protein NTU48_09200, partial [Legionellales bacterium]|nr:hypothetical protein [Legionellales bacterium]